MPSSLLFFMGQAMSEYRVVNACQSPFITVEAWKIPELKSDEQLHAPGWAVSALFHAASIPDSGGYGSLVGRWIVREGIDTKILYDVDFRRKYITYATISIGAVRAHYAQASAECQARDYLTAMAAYLKHLGGLWEGPDGCGTYELEALEAISEKLRDLAGRSDVAGDQAIMPFLYLPKAGA